MFEKLLMKLGYWLPKLPAAPVEYDARSVAYRAKTLTYPKPIPQSDSDTLEALGRFIKKEK